MTNRTEVRLATDEEFRVIYGKAPPPAWVGFVGDRGGRLLGCAGVVWENGHAIAFFDKTEKVSAFALHRGARLLFRVLRQVGETVVYAGCDEKIPGAAKWLKRLGFVPVSTDVWRAEL